MNDPDFQRRLKTYAMLGPTNKRYYPVFSGRTEDGGKVVIYMNLVDDSLHIVRPDGEFWALSLESVIEDYFNVDREIYRIEITSPEWTGQASGTRKDLLEEDMR
jgi:hypothetical protein